jgi:hypothetical protein
MVISKFVEMRINNDLRDAFLIKLAKQNKYYITQFSKKIAGGLITSNIIDNECMQYFMLGANRGIDRANIVDDGRGNNDPEQFCRTCGIYNVRDFLVQEFRLNRKHRIEFTELTATAYGIAEDRNYENETLSDLMIEEIIARLKPLDRKILQLIMYGETDSQQLVPCFTNKNRLSNNMIQTVANTLGYSSSYITSRIYNIRGVLSTLPIL